MYSRIDNYFKLLVKTRHKIPTIIYKSFIFLNSYLIKYID